jgi:CRISPR-associated protein Cas1
MKMLLLDGHGIDVRVNSAKLHIKNGRSISTEEYVFSPKRMDIDHIIIYGRNGNLTLDAVKWLIKHNVQVSILNWDGQ